MLLRAEKQILCFKIFILLPFGLCCLVRLQRSPSQHVVLVWGVDCRRTSWTGINSFFVKLVNTSCCQVLVSIRNSYHLTACWLWGITLSNFSGSQTCLLCSNCVCRAPDVSVILTGIWSFRLLSFVTALFLFVFTCLTIKKRKLFKWSNS